MAVTREQRLEYERRYRERNKDRVRRMGREWAKTERGKRTTRNNFLKQRYGITIEDYEELLKHQGHVCKLCGRSAGQEGRALAVDHCHETGRVRGLLCTGCNTTLGRIEKCPHLFRRMLNYLGE